VRKDEALAIQVNRAAGAPLPAAEAAAQTPKFKREKLQAGAFVYSTALFPKYQVVNNALVEVPNQTVKAQLAQDASGRVVDKTIDMLTGEQNALKALKHAEMVLNNYAPKDGDTIYITGGGQHAAQAKMVLAALLLLRDGNPALKHVKIVSEVPGCVAPEAPVASTFRFMGAGEDQDTVNHNFIKQHLPPRFVSEEKQRRLQAQVGQFMGAKVGITEQFKLMKEQLRLGKKEGGTELTSDEKFALARQMQELGVTENEEIDAEWNRTRLER